MKWLIFYSWILSLLGVAFYTHEFAYVDGALDERALNKNKLESCQKLAVANMFEVP